MVYLNVEPVKDTTLIPFSDIKTLSDEQKHSLLNYFYFIFPDDTQTEFRPLDFITRAEATVFLDRLLKKF